LLLLLVVNFGYCWLPLILAPHIIVCIGVKFESGIHNNNLGVTSTQIAKINKYYILAIIIITLT
jgi:hypothetical protein